MVFAGRWTICGGDMPYRSVVVSTKDDAIDSWGPEQTLRFEELLTDLSVRFINLPADQVDMAIEEAQRHVCECIGLDLSALWQWDPEVPDSLVLTHSYRRLDGPPVPVRMQASEYFPWTLCEMMAGRIVLISSLDNVPAGAGRDLEAWRHFGLKNMLCFPLSAGGVTFGVVSFHDMVTPRTWCEQLIKQLQLVAQVFANAIIRKRSERLLKEGEERLASAIEVAGLGFYEMGREKRISFLDDQSRALLGVPADKVPDAREFWLAHIHQEDLPQLLQVSREILEQGMDRFATDYRYLHPERGLIYIHHLSHVLQRDAAGRAVRTIGVIQDITERTRVKIDLEESRTQISAVMNSTGDFIWSVDPERFGLMTWNQSLRDYFFERLHIEIKAGMTPADLLPPEFAPKWPAMYTRALQEGSYVTEYGVAAGTNILLLSIHPMRREGKVFGISVFGKDITEHKRVETALRQSLDEVRHLRDRLQSENVYLREQVRHETGYGTIIGESELVQKMIAMARMVAPTDSAVLITGETGTGKELLAQAIHDLSSRKGKTMVKVNCAALPAALIESELFGREKGAYTGAMTQQAGRFEVADGSTIFLDEIGDLPLDLQTKLLRVLQDGQYERLGSNRTLKTNVRVIAATNRNLGAMVAKGTFREDLFHRLNVFPVEVPPLRARVDDIPLMVWIFVQEFNAKMGRSIDSIPKPVMARLKQYPWPGNVRELRNVIERAMIVSEGCSLRIELPESGPSVSPSSATLEDVERQHILDVLERTRWKISGKGGAAEILGLVPTTLQSRLKKLGLSRPQP
jgi:transcriptional regulator with GAF, ATPase, and Fis domain